MTLLVRKPGILDTIQDCGRFGFRRFGINTCGAMDASALRIGSIILGNQECEAGLEMHFPAPVLEFGRSAAFALSGAEFDARLNSEPIERNAIHTDKKRDVLEFKKRISGQRCYLIVKDGFKLDAWLGSKSTYLAAKVSGFEGRQLRKGDVLTIKPGKPSLHSLRASTEFDRKNSRNYPLRFIPGPDYRDLTALSMLALRNGEFLVRKNSNRMGYRLEGPPLHLLYDDEKISAAVTFGTIQLLPDSQLIILMADHQTSGGYPNIGTITSCDLSVAAQLGPGDSIKLEPVTIAKAEDIERVAEREIAILKAGLQMLGAWKS